MAESIEGTEPPVAQPGFDEAKMAELISKNVNSSLKEAIAALPQPEPQYQQPQQVDTPVEPDFWDQQINPRVDGKIANVNLRALAAEDKVDFFSSEAWTTELDEMLPGDTPEEIAQHKKEIRLRLEKTFTTMLQSGRGTRRADILDYEVGKYLREKKSEFKDSVVKKAGKSREAELEKARRGVDISSGNISNFTAQDIHDMDFERVVKEFGQVGF
jgi:hypothetical protein